jgi:hypothetical protein
MPKGRHPTRHISLRLPEATAKAVDRVEEDTGWNATKALAYLANAGAAVLFNTDGDLAVERGIYQAWCDRHTAEQRSAMILKIANAKLRTATAAARATGATPPARKAGRKEQPK